jgi:aerobic-type carbon monoxide dehydrogenase small subunit (CoxS/CutS family)
MTEHRIQLAVNGKSSTHDLAVDRRLIDVLRDDLGLTGTKEGCGVGVCGLCAVLVDDELMSACLLPAVLADGRTVETVEGLAADGRLSALQEAFIVHGAFQCGICTPGQLMAATALLRENPHPAKSQIQGWMNGNLCRCTGYEGIMRAIVAAAGEPE